MTGWTWSLAAGFVLDLLIGDPPLPFHPVRLIGTFAAAAERFLRPKFPPFAAGALSWTATVSASAAAGWGAMEAAGALFGSPGKIAAGGILVWSSIAVRDLAGHALRVKKALDSGDQPLARSRVGMIVGRKTDTLGEEEIAKAAVESVAESFIDGVAAPLFWAAVFGPIGAVAYRSINTMDSMFGHKNERYLRFGRLAARADDAATWIPARLAALVPCLAAPVAGGSPIAAVRILLRDRLKHESPNSAHGEAAFAGALELALGGPTEYAEGVIEKPFIGDRLGKSGANASDIGRAVTLMVVSSIAWAALMVAAQAIFNHWTIISP